MQLIDVKAKEKPTNFIVADYMNSSFVVLGGANVELRLLFDNSLVNAVIDRPF